MRILWINESASLVGTCEQYIYHTAKLLKAQGIESSFLYETEADKDPSLLDVFAISGKIKDLPSQLKMIPHDLVYVHRLNSETVLKSIQETKVPIIRFFHDYHLFCLRKNKILPFKNSPCNRLPSCKCYPFLFSLRWESHFPWFSIQTLWQLQKKQKINQQLDGYIVPSEYVAQLVVRSGFDPEKLRTIPLYAIDRSLGRVERDSHLILFVGRLNHSGGVDLAIQAVGNLGSPYKLVIAGEGDKNRYQKLVKRLNLDDRVTFLGKVPQEDLMQWYQRAACLVFLPRYPTLFGQVGVEAMSFETPVIAADVGAVPEWLQDEKSGFLVPPNDIERLTKAIQNLSTDRALRIRLGKEGRRIYEENYLPQYHLEDLVTYFQEAIETKRKKLPVRKYTICGSKEDEEILHSFIEEVKYEIRNEIPEKLYRTILLTGEFGKGEGGVYRDQSHHPIEFLIITRRSFSNVTKKLKKLISPIIEKYGISVKIREISEFRIKMSPHSLILYEMVQGNKFLLGDPNFIRSLPFDQVDLIREKDFLDLMVKKGGLLIANHALLDSSKTGLDKKQKKIFVENIMEAILGYGDAYLFFHGHYHWSRKERLARILIHPDTPQVLKENYQMAVEFSFFPHYESYFHKDFASWLSSVETWLASIFFECEKVRLDNIDLSPTNYWEIRLSDSLKKGWSSVQGWLQKGKGLLHLPKAFFGNTTQEKFSFWTLSPSERLSIIFPIIAFDAEGKMQAALYLNTKANSLIDLRKAYLDSETSLIE